MRQIPRPHTVWFEQISRLPAHSGRAQNITRDALPKRDATEGSKSKADKIEMKKSEIRLASQPYWNTFSILR